MAITVAASAWMSGSASRASAYLVRFRLMVMVTRAGAWVRARVRVRVRASAYMGLRPPRRKILRWLAAWLESSESARAAWKATSSSAALPYLSVSAAERALVSE